MNNQPRPQFRNIAYLSDVTGTGFWRHIQQMLSANSASQHLGIYNTYTQAPVLDQNYYRGMTSVTVQRWLTTPQAQMFLGFLKPVCDANGSWLIYEIDDAMHYDEIPLYNKGRAAFESDEMQQNIKNMLNAADFVIVTTQHLKEYYNKKYGIPIDNLIAVPNLLPRWWFGEKYSLQQSVDGKKAFKAKPRIGIVSSLSHYNFCNFKQTADGKVARPDDTGKWKLSSGEEVDESVLLPIEDDIDQVADVIESTANDFQWVFFGFCPPRFQKLQQAGKIEVHGTTSILNYPNKIKSLKLQAIVAPLVLNEFNFCKSPIKFLECCAVGVPLFATRCLPYKGVMEDSMLFSSKEELKDKLLKLKFMSTGAYEDLVSRNWTWFNSPHVDGDFNLVNYWLDDNMKIWYDLFRLRRKTMKVQFSTFVKKYEEAKKAKEASTIYSKNGVEILK